jgi:uncharacterized protein YcbK (DUF882 family)
MQAAFIRDFEEGVQQTEGVFRSSIHTAGHADDINLDVVRVE